MARHDWGYRSEMDYIYFIVPTALVGEALYFLKSPDRTILSYAQDGAVKLITGVVVIAAFLAQLLTWSILYGLGLLLK